MKEVAHDDVLGFVERGSHTTLTVHPGKRLDNNHSLNTVDICPVGALTSKDFRFKMRVWFLKETKTIDVSCGTGSNIIIGSRENTIYRITPRQNEAVNSYWMPDSHRLNYTYLHREDRLLTPFVRNQENDHVLQKSQWSEALHAAAKALHVEEVGSIAMIVSGRMTNDELVLARRLKEALSITLVDIRPRPQEGDGFLIAKDGNPNTRGVQLLGLAGEEPGALLGAINEGIEAGTITSLLVLHENVISCGISEAALKKLKNLIVLDILPSATTQHATILLPGSAAAEKRGSMINIKGRLQRLNQAIQAPGAARDDWEILQDLLKLISSSTVPITFEELFAQMASEISSLRGLNFGKIGDLGIDLTLLK
jgi:NADH-quinone oxidoreductase subunit G